MKDNITKYSKTLDNPSAEDANYKKGKNEQYILNSDGNINISTNDHVLDYKCVPDPNVYGDITELKSQLELVNENDNRYSKGTTMKSYDADEEQPKYLYVNSSNINPTLEKYAEITGVYKNTWTTNDKIGNYFENTIVKYDDGSGNRYKAGTNDDQIHIKGDKPLICNELYPYLLDSMEDKEKNQELKCEYAKKCGVSWSYLDCYGDKGILSSIPLNVKNSAAAAASLGAVASTPVA
jgi:hypothetical protein